MPGAFDREPVAAAVDHVSHGHPRLDVSERSARENGETRSPVLRQSPERPPECGGKDCALGEPDDGREGAVVIEDQDQPGPLGKLAPEAVGEPARKAQDPFAPSTSSGIRASSLKRRPAHR